MKNRILLLFAILLIASCGKQVTLEGPARDKWNGYGKYLKTGEQVHTLWAGKNINIGTVTYGIDADANFYVTYDCSASGWKMSETHMFAGDKKNMPMNKPGAPKVGLFPFVGIHTPGLSIVTYHVALSQLPPCESPGFVVAAHAVVHSPWGQTETAWAEGNYTFSDKGWGWYDDYYYNTPPNPTIFLYGMEYSANTLTLYHIDVVYNRAEIILQEYITSAAGTLDGAAYDPGSGIFLFSNSASGQLWVNLLQGDDPSFLSGTLSGISTSGTFYNGSYYYVAQGPNSINKVDFTETWLIASETALDTIPAPITVNDIAMAPEGQILYILGHSDGGGTSLVTWATDSHQFSNTTVSIDENAQIAFGSNGLLYAISPGYSEGDSTCISLVDLTAISFSPLDEQIIVIEGGNFSDLAGGPGF